MPLEPLAQRLEAWLTLPSLSRWLTRTIRLGYAIQFARQPPKFNGVLETSVAVRNAPVLREEIAVLLAKDAIEPVPPTEMRQGFYSPYFIVPKKGGGLRPILDLRVLNRALHKLPFKMLTHRRMIKCIQPQDWFAAIDLKDAYFHVSILPRHRPFLRFAFEGRACGDHRDLVLRHLSQLGLRVNWEKSKLSPVQRISFLGVELDSVSMTARLTEERAQAVLNCLSSFRGRNVVPLKQFQRLLGHMASAAAVTPLGLLHMRPLQHWLHSRVLRWAWRRGTLRVGISQQCRRSLSPWTDLAFLRAGVPLEQVSRHTVVTTDASSTGWGATCNGQAASGLWTGPRLLWHINCLELWAVHLALRQFRPLLLGKHVLVRTDNTAAVSYINRLGGIRSHRMSQLARHLLLWSHTGQAASAPHAMAILQVHQAKALKQVHEGSTDPGLMQELRTATDFALRATKVTARSLGKAMSTMVVQELNLAEMKDVDKARFLDAPISQGGLFGDTVEGFAQQFSAVQQQTEAIQHILPRRDAPSTAAPGARPQSARRRGRPPASSRAAPPQAELTHRPVRRASRRRAAPPASQPGPKSSRKSTKRP